MMIPTIFIAKMCVPVSKCLGNGTSDGKKQIILLKLTLGQLTAL